MNEFFSFVKVTGVFLLTVIKSAVITVCVFVQDIWPSLVCYGSYLWNQVQILAIHIHDYFSSIMA